MSQYIDHLHEEEIVAVVKATLREEQTHSIMDLLGLPVDGTPVSFADRLDIQVRALKLDEVVAKRLADEERERRRVRIIESDIHYATRKARALVNDLLDRLDSDIPQWVMEFDIESTFGAMEEFECGGAVGEVTLDESLHLQGHWDIALQKLLSAIRELATDENAEYNADAVRIA